MIPNKLLKQLKDVIPSMRKDAISLGVPEDEFHLVFTDLDDYPEADECPGFNHTVGWVTGVADGLEMDVYDLLDCVGV